jgi:hypothetical protein
MKKTCVQGAHVWVGKNEQRGEFKRQISKSPCGNALGDAVADQSRFETAAVIMMRECLEYA